MSLIYDIFRVRVTVGMVSTYSNQIVVHQKDVKKKKPQKIDM